MYLPTPVSQDLYDLKKQKSSISKLRIHRFKNKIALWNFLEKEIKTVNAFNLWCKQKQKINYIFTFKTKNLFIFFGYWQLKKIDSSNKN